MDCEDILLQWKTHTREIDCENCKYDIESDSNLSVTPQTHVTEDHTASHIVNIPRDVGYMTEYFVERSRQDNIGLDYRLQNRTK